MSYTLSVLGDNPNINNIIHICGEELMIETGFIGELQEELFLFLKGIYRLHILFVIPSRENNGILERIKMISNLNIYIIWVGSILPEDGISLYLNSGISGFITISDLTCAEISFIVKSIHSKGYVVNKYITNEWWESKKLKEHRSPHVSPHFSETELQVATYLANGYTISQIASFRGKSESSVRFHIKNLLVKSKTYSIREFIVKCITNLWVKVSNTKTNNKHCFTSRVGID